MAISKSYKARGVVLNTLRYGDNSLIIHLLTDQMGRQSYIMQGGQRRRGGQRALFQPLFTVEFEGKYPTRGELHRFTEVSSGIVLRRTPFDLRRSSIALFIAEVLYRLIKESEPNSSLFNFIWGAIESLDQIEQGIANFHLWFLTNLSRELGFMPLGEWSEHSVIDIREGLFCSYTPHHGEVLSARSTELIYTLLQLSAQNIGSLQLNRTERVELLEGLIRFYNYHLDEIGSVQSIAVLREIY